MNMRQQAEAYMNQAIERKRSPIGASSTAGYGSYIRKWIIPELGSLELEKVKPSTVKPLVEKMIQAGLSPATINQVVDTVKRIMASVTDEEGQPLYPRVWNNQFMDVPIVVKADQKAPILEAGELQEAIRRAKGQDRALYVILAASGARIGEIQALRMVKELDTDSYWNRETGTLFIRSTFAHGEYQPWPKTDAGYREIDLHPAVNSYLMRAGLPKKGWMFRGLDDRNSRYLQTTAGQHLRKNGIRKGFHSFRRFRSSHLDCQGVPDGLSRFWAGHAAKDVHQSYIKIGKNLEVRKFWAEKAGIGFEL